MLDVLIGQVSRLEFDVALLRECTRAAIVAQPIGDGPEGQAESLRWKRAP